MNSRSSESIASGGQWGLSLSSSRCHQWSRPSVISANDSSPSPPCPRRTTTTCRMLGQSATASSAMRLSGSTWPRR